YAEHPQLKKNSFRTISIDTWTGMLFSNVIAFFIIVTTAATLHSHGVTHIDTAAQAAEALRPIGGPFAFALFAAGIIGTGLLAVTDKRKLVTLPRWLIVLGWLAAALMAIAVGLLIWSSL